MTSNQKKVLIVEDDFYIRDLYNQVFKSAGFDVDLAQDGEEALIKTDNRQDYDIILLDIMLPKITGIDVLKSIKATSSPAAKIPVFLITNLGHDNVIKQGFKLGADGYLLKAKLTPQEILTEVNTFLSERSANKDILTS